MNKIVFDASAVLALLNQEHGYQVAETYLPHAVISTVNLSEVIAVLTADFKLNCKETQELLQDIIQDVIPFTREQAYIAGQLRLQIKRFGLSLGDCACLALARQQKLPVLTADKTWQKIDLGIKVVLLR